MGCSEIHSTSHVVTSGQPQLACGTYECVRMVHKGRVSSAEASRIETYGRHGRVSCVAFTETFPLALLGTAAV